MKAFENITLENYMRWKTTLLKKFMTYCYAHAVIYYSLHNKQEKSNAFTKSVVWWLLFEDKMLYYQRNCSPSFPFSVKQDKLDSRGRIKDDEEK